MLSPSALSTDQCDRLREAFAWHVVDGMDGRTLERFALEALESQLLRDCATPEALCDEIASLYDQETLEELLSSL